MVRVEARSLRHAPLDIVVHGADNIDLADDTSLGELIPHIGSPAGYLRNGIAKRH